VHLNPNVRRTVLPLLGDHERVHLLDPLPYATFVEAMARSYLIVTDSGGVQEEAPALGKPVLVFREVTERREGLSAAGAKLVGLGAAELRCEAEILLRDPEAYRRMAVRQDLYGDGRAGERVVQAILHHFGRGPAPRPFSPAGPSP
jgi:UDP-N-acetylglucosamine 2-epimerase (non-hydrolysing)